MPNEKLQFDYKIDSLKAEHFSFVMRSKENDPKLLKLIKEAQAKEYSTKIIRLDPKIYGLNMVDFWRRVKVRRLDY